MSRQIRLITLFCTLFVLLGTTGRRGRIGGHSWKSCHSAGSGGVKPCRLPGHRFGRGVVYLPLYLAFVCLFVLCLFVFDISGGWVKMRLEVVSSR